MSVKLLVINGLRNKTAVFSRESNQMLQVKTFNEALSLTGLIMTKLDGTAKGGVLIGLVDQYKLPIRFIGVGEKMDDLRPFEARLFTDALFS